MSNGKLLEEEIDAAALVMLIENHNDEFEEYAGGVESAAKTWDALRRAAGMEAA